LKDNKFFTTLILSEDDRPFSKDLVHHIHEIPHKGSILFTILSSPESEIGPFQKRLLSRHLISRRRERTSLPRRDE
jgi:hypothetical protein